MSLNRLGLSGNHVTILGVTAILALVSGTVWSVDAFTNVALQDPVNGRKAAIDPLRQTLVKDARSSTDLIQANYIRFWDVGSTPCNTIATPPANKSLIIKTLTVNTYINTTPGYGRVVYFYVGSTCSGTPVGSINPPGIGLQNISLEPGVVVPNGQSLWASTSAGLTLEIFGTGYSVPSVWAPPSQPVATSMEVGAVQGLAKVPSAPQKSPDALGNGG